MDTHQLKQRIDASVKKLAKLGNECIKLDEIEARKVMLKIFGDISKQTLVLGEQGKNNQIDFS